MKSIVELHADGLSIRSIARTLGVSRNSVRKYLAAPGVPRARKRGRRPGVLDAYKPYVEQRLGEGVLNCVVLLREIRARGYQGGYSTLKEFVEPLRRARPVRATVRFETEPGQQAQVDFGEFRYHMPDGRARRVWGFVMVLSWSRAIYVEFVPQADTAAFMRCHVNAFAHFGGMPERCLYDNTKTVVLERDAGGEPRFNPRFLDFSLRLGFEIKLCHPYRAQTKGRVESGIKYVRHNFWSTARFVDLEDLNQQARAWWESVADVRIHGTTRERPGDRLERERALLRALPGAERLQPFLREERLVGRDCFVRWQRAAYGVPWPWAGQRVEVQASDELVEIWSGERRLAVHPRATHPGQHLVTPGQWEGLPGWEKQPRREALAVQVADVEVEKRPLGFYERASGGW